MGASKRLCEKYIQNISLSSNFTKFSIVRFGNVLGSTGSVVPLFQEQIKQGGPITITDPKVSRYFMTIREAVELVLISSQLETKEGEIFILEMGKPILIKDLAKSMINLLGRKENEIKIIFTGLRKGEKLSEQLFFNEEKITDTSIDGILSTTDKIYNVDTTDYNILVSYIQKNEIKKAIEKFKKMLPEYNVDVKNKY